MAPFLLAPDLDEVLFLAGDLAPALAPFLLAGDLAPDLDEVLFLAGDLDPDLVLFLAGDLDEVLFLAEDLDEVLFLAGDLAPFLPAESSWNKKDCNENL